MNVTRGTYRALRVMRAAKAVRRGRVPAYLRRSIMSTAVAKLTWRIR